VEPPTRELERVRITAAGLARLDRHDLERLVVERADAMLASEIDDAAARDNRASAR